MSAKQPDLRTIKEGFGGTAKRARNTGRKAMLAYVGVLGFIYDNAKVWWRSSADFADRAEHRGEEIEAVLDRKAGEIREQISTESKQLRSQVDDGIRGITRSIAGRGKRLEKKVQSAARRVGSESTPAMVEPVTIAVAVGERPEPMAGYDGWNAQEVIDGLAELETVELHQVREYEAAHKNRVTVLRAIADCLEDPAQQVDA